MTELTVEQRGAIKQVYSATSQKELTKALSGFEEVLPAGIRSNKKREQIAEMLIEDSSGERAKQQIRTITMLALIDTSNAAEAIASFAHPDTVGIDERVQAHALVSLKNMSSSNDICSLLQHVQANEDTQNRVKALSLRLLIQCHAEDREAREKYSDQLAAMGKDENADHKWAALRSLRENDKLGPLPEDVEQSFISDLVAPILRDDFEWQDVRTEAALVLGDTQHQLAEAMVQLSLAFKSSSTAIIRRYCIGAMRSLADPKKMNNAERDAGPFNEIMLIALNDDSYDVRSRAYTALNEILKPKAAIELIVNQVLQQAEEPSTGQLDALRYFDDNKDRSSEALRIHLLDLDPDKVERATIAMTKLGGAQAFRTLFAQSERTLERYSEVLNETDNRITGQHDVIIRQARWAFWISLAMHVTIFLLGVWILYNTYDSWDGTLEGLRGLFGIGGGIIAIIMGLFYRNPVRSINVSVTRLVKVNVAFLGFMRQITQIDATFKQLFLAPTGFSFKDMEETVGQIQKVVDQSLEKIQTYLVVDESSSSGGLKEGAKKGADAVGSQESVREKFGSIVDNTAERAGLGV